MGTVTKNQPWRRRHSGPVSGAGVHAVTANNTASVPRRRALLVALLSVLTASGLAGIGAVDARAEQPKPPGQHEKTGQPGATEPVSNIENFGWSDHEGRQRHAQFYVSAAAKRAAAKGRKLPLVLVLHGGNGRPGRARNVTGLDHFAEQHGFLTAYPGAWSNPDYPRQDKRGRWIPARNRHWNDGRNDPTIPNQRDQIDDMPFLRAVVGTAAARFGADTGRVYALGLSNGGFLSLKIACTEPDFFRGIAPVISLVPKSVAGNCAKTGPVSMVMIVGTDDPVIDFHARNGRKRPVYWLSGRDSIDLWRRKNSCPRRASSQKKLPDRLISDRSSVVVEDWQNCGSDTRLRFYKVVGGGHTLPRPRTQFPPASGRVKPGFRRHRTHCPVLWPGPVCRQQLIGGRWSG